MYQINMSKKKKVVITIKREIWKGKARIVARKNGKIFNSKPFSPKRGFTLSRLRDQFKRTNSFDKDISVNINSFTNVIEHTDTRKVPMKPGKGRKFQGFARALVNGQLIEARSQNRFNDESKKSAIDEAVRNLMARIADALGLAYDENEGLKIIEEQKIQIKTGIIFYTKK